MFIYTQSTAEILSLFCHHAASNLYSYGYVGQVVVNAKRMCSDNGVDR